MGLNIILIISRILMHWLPTRFLGLFADFLVVLVQVSIIIFWKKGHGEHEMSFTEHEMRFTERPILVARQNSFHARF